VVGKRRRRKKTMGEVQKKRQFLLGNVGSAVMQTES
jgi:hypothetical protein